MKSPEKKIVIVTTTKVEVIPGTDKTKLSAPVKKKIKTVVAVTGTAPKVKAKPKAPKSKPINPPIVEAKASPKVSKVTKPPARTKGGNPPSPNKVPPGRYDMLLS